MTSRHVVPALFAAMALAVSACAQGGSQDRAGAGSAGDPGVSVRAAASEISPPPMTSSSSPAPPTADAASGDAPGARRGSKTPGSAVGTSPVAPGGASGSATPLDATASRTNATNTTHTKDAAGQQVSTKPAGTKPASTSLPNSEPPELGRIGTEILGTAGFLAPEGAIRLDVSQRPDDAAVNAAMCSYVFGAPEDVGFRAALAAAPTLDPVSGYYVEDADAAGDLDAARGFVLCGYLVDGFPLVALEVGHSNDPWAKGKNVFVHDGSVQAVVSYSPVYQGAPIPEAAATAWLQEALARIHY